jgi:hypothetical protein
MRAEKVTNEARRDLAFEPGTPASWRGALPTGEPGLAASPALTR